MRTDVDGTADWTTPGAFEVVSGLFRIPLPLLGDALRAVNVYAFLDGAGGDGVGLIDSGWAIPSAHRQLRESLAAIDRRIEDIQRILVTHVHRDHYTEAVQLRREFGSRVGLGQGERTSLEIAMSPREVPWEAQLSKLRSQGAAVLADEIAVHLRTETMTGDEWEEPDDWLAPGETELSGRRLRAIATPGHTQGHLVFHDADRALLFAGDHVLPGITPSIGFESAPSINPLGDFLTSLATVRAIPDARLLPAHGAVTDSVHARVDELAAHHDVRLAATELAVRAGASTAFEVAVLLRWTRRERDFDELDRFNQMLAINETSAHLLLLASRGQITSTVLDDVRHFG